MAYTKKTWQKGDLIKATDLNHMEDGIEQASQETGVQHVSLDIYYDVENEEKCLAMVVDDNPPVPIDYFDLIDLLNEGSVTSANIYNPATHEVLGTTTLIKCERDKVFIGDSNLYNLYLKPESSEVYLLQEDINPIPAYAPALYMDFVDDFIPEEEERVLSYWPEDSDAAPIVDADAISDMMLNRAVKWNIQYDERVLAIVQTNFTQVSDGVVGITEIKCSDGSILTRNSNNHFVISAGPVLAYLNHERFGNCLALVNNSDGTIVSVRATDVMKHLNDINNRWIVMYASSLALQAINTLQYHQDEEFPTIIIGNGDTFDVDIIDHDYVFVLYEEPQYES